MRFDPSNPPDLIEFEGVAYRRMGGARRYYLSQSTTNAGRKGAKGLHVAIWESANGKPVPQGFEVHHCDNDVFNFDADNLECLPFKVHRALPRTFSAAVAAHLDEIRPLASAWHKSDEGREWHRNVTSQSLDKARAAKATTPPRPGGVCCWCGSGFTFKNRRKVYCGSVCQLQHSGYRRGKYKFVHPHHAASLQSDGS